MKIPTLFVHPDEPAYGLREEPRTMLQPDGSQQLRWVQTVFVVRDDTIASHATDYGPAENFQKITPLFLWSEGDDTVAQLRDLAERNRHDTYWYDRAQAQKAESTLIRDAIAQMDARAEYIRRNHRTVKEFV